MTFNDLLENIDIAVSDPFYSRPTSALSSKELETILDKNLSVEIEYKEPFEKVILTKNNNEYFYIKNKHVVNISKEDLASIIIYSINYKIYEI